MTATESIVWGVVTGILTSALLLIINQLFQKVFLPWYETLGLQIIDICGEWEMSLTFAETKNESYFLFKFDQKGQRIKCTVSETKKIVATSGSETRIFHFNGTFDGRFLTLAGRNSNRKSLGVHSYLFELQGGGDILQGFVSRYCITDNKLKSDPARLKRK